MTSLDSRVGFWTEARINAAGTFIPERLAADFRDTGLPTIELRIDPTWSGSKHVPRHPRPEDVIVVCGGHEFPLALGDDVEYACAHAAYQLQDDVIAERRQPWPELLESDGQFVGVLTPPLTGDAIAHWQLGDKPFCAIGQLHRAVEAAGLTVKGVH